MVICPKHTILVLPCIGYLVGRILAINGSLVKFPADKSILIMSGLRSVALIQSSRRDGLSQPYENQSVFCLAVSGDLSANNNNI